MALDTVIKSNKIFTAEVGKDECVSGAIGIQDGKIIVVGPVDEVMAQADAETEVIDATDKFVCPGFNDSHVHFKMSAVFRSRYSFFCEGTCVEDIIEALKTVEHARPEEEFMIGFGWYNSVWSDPSVPTKEILDKNFPGRAIGLQSGDGHSVWLSSKGLEKLGIDRDTVAPEGGIIQKDENGEPTGIIQEAAVAKYLPQIQALTEEEMATAARDFMAELNAEGITMIGDVAGAVDISDDGVDDETYVRLQERGELTLRVDMFPTALEDLSRARKLRDQFAGDDMLYSTGLKQFFDGVSSTHTAWLTEPYANPYFEGDCGRPTVKPELMRKIVMGAVKEGFPVRIHAIGDRSVHEALKIFVEAQEAYGTPTSAMMGLEHVENILEEDIELLVKSGAAVNAQCAATVIDPEGIERDLGPERIKLMWPLRTFIDRGITISLGTDTPCFDINSRAVIYDAVTRQNPATGLPAGGWQPQEKITAAEALRAYTLGSATIEGLDAKVGSIEPGKFADLAILDTNLIECDPESIMDAKVLATYLGGKAVYTA